MYTRGLRWPSSFASRRPARCLRLVGLVPATMRHSGEMFNSAPQPAVHLSPCTDAASIFVAVELIYAAPTVGKKILIDQLLYAPVFTVILYTYLQAAHGDLAGIPEVLQDKVVPTLLANYAVWPLAHALNFYYVPTEQRILYNNFIAVRHLNGIVAWPLVIGASCAAPCALKHLILQSRLHLCTVLYHNGELGCHFVQVCWTTWLSCLAH